MLIKSLIPEREAVDAKVSMAFALQECENKKSQL